MEPIRAKRIRIRLNKIAKAFKVAKRIILGWGNLDAETWAFNYALKHKDHLKVCSCMMCGNPRKHFNAKTKQELMADIATIEQIKEIGL